MSIRQKEKNEKKNLGSINYLFRFALFIYMQRYSKVINQRVFGVSA